MKDKEKILYVHDLEDEIDFLFNGYFKARRNVLVPVKGGWRPLTDMYETEDEVVIVMDIAGISPKDLKTFLHGDTLIINGIRREQSSLIKRKYHKMEIDFGHFERRIELPVSINPDGVTARYLQGFLEIRFQKLDHVVNKNVEIKIK